MPGSKLKTADERGMHRLRLEAARNPPYDGSHGNGRHLFPELPQNESFP